MSRESKPFSRQKTTKLVLLHQRKTNPLGKNKAVALAKSYDLIGRQADLQT